MLKHVLAFCILAVPALADSPRVTDVRGLRGAGGWSFSVTVSHADEGWDHYADGWEIAGPDGTQFGFRTLHHPHEGEHSFTRSLSGVRIPEGVDEVHVRARDNVHGWGAPVIYRLPR
ncbi:hypothetical protein [Roseobacter sp. HKCCA0434]|uniref:hypothetical protein n=1 Tax=Roseobacter sp. HKCCA0434 TaxID=3079297 RepID=UPI002905F296|nr:hypothetical protein [Roseobacter sp. HKCCA0434]